jgi:hypothetical protein
LTLPSNRVFTFENAKLLHPLQYDVVEHSPVEELHCIWLMHQVGKGEGEEGGGEERGKGCAQHMGGEMAAARIVQKYKDSFACNQR